MKKYISFVLIAVLIVSCIHLQQAQAEPESSGDIYNESYGNQLDEGESSLSRIFYNAMVSTYLYSEDDLDSMNKDKAGLAKPVTDDGVIVLEPESLMCDKTFESKQELETYIEQWYEEKNVLIDYGFRAAFDAFIKDYPEVYWLKGVNMNADISLNYYGSEQAGYEGKAIIQVTITPTEYETGMWEYVEQFNEAVCEAKNSIINTYNITTDTRPETVAKAIHDYIALHTDYNFEAVDDDKNPDYNYAHTPLPVFVSSDNWSSEVVCEGYAKAFKILCGQFGIENAILIGNATNSQGEMEAHMWNAVQIEGKWYAVDVAWDDQEDYISDTYFLSGNKTMGFYDIFENDHISINYFSEYEDSKLFILPMISEYRFGSTEETTSYESETSDKYSETESGETTTDKTLETTTVEITTTPENNTENYSTTKAPEISTTGYEVATTKKVTMEETTNTITYYWTLTGLKNAEYTGKPVKLNLVFKCNGSKLKEGKDYKISYKNNVSAGTATVTITAIGRFKNVKPSSYSYNFAIEKASIAKATAKKVRTQKYKKGKAVKPAVKLTYNGKTLKKNKDYTLSYKNNTKKGTAQIIVKGKGNFKGTKKIKFKIK